MITFMQYPHGFTSGPSYNLATQAARRKNRASSRFRCPHYSTSTIGLISELAIAAGGVLYLYDFHRFSRWALKDLFSAWQLMDPEHRPHIVIKAQTGMIDDSGSRYANASWHQIGDPDFYEIIPRIDEHIIVTK